MRALESHQSAAIAKHSLKEGWEHIEDQDEVGRVLEKIRTTTRFDVYRCAEQYEMAYTGYEGDDEYYLEKTSQGHALYVGVGTGRLFGKMAEANPGAVGLDNSPEMLELLRRRYPHIKQNQVMLADATEAPLAENQFDTIVAPYSFLQVLDEEKIPKFLDNVRRWLKPGGRFCTDTFSPYLIQFQRKGLEANVRQINADTRIAIYVMYDHEKQNMTEFALIDESGDEQVLEMRLHYFFPNEILKAMRDAGFEEYGLAGGYHGEPFDTTENEVIVYEAMKAREGNGHTPAHSGNGRLIRNQSAARMRAV